MAPVNYVPLFSGITRRSTALSSPDPQNMRYLPGRVEGDVELLSLVAEQRAAGC